MAVYSSTYRNVVESLRQVCNDHPAIKTFRCGPASMIEIPTEDQQVSAKYPYVMLVPQPATINQGSTTYDFDLVVMDMAKDKLDLEERTHSNTMEILRDILAKYKMTTWAEFRFNVNLPAIATPFFEGYKNSTCGWSVQLQIEALAPLDHCNNPVA